MISKRIEDIIGVNDAPTKTFQVMYLDYVTDENDDEKKRLKRDLKIESIIDDVDNDEKIEAVDSLHTPFKWDDTDNTQLGQEIGLKIFTKSSTLTESIECKYFVNTHPVDIEPIAIEENYDSIEKQLFNDIVKHIKSNAEQHMKSFKPTHGFKDLDFTKDVNNSQLSHKDWISKKLFHKCLATSNIIATQGRRGPGNFAITNQKIYDLLKEYGNGSMQISNMKFVIDNSLGDEVIHGRKGKSDEAGSHLFYRLNNFLEPDSEGFGYNVVTRLDYEIVDIGAYHYSQFSKVNIQF